MATSWSPTRPGAIIYMSLSNFMIYREVGFYPGRGLNMVLGPNGAGKSSLLCAACVALGGDLEALRRQRDASELVGRHGGKARVRVRLSRGEGRSYWDVECVLHRDKGKDPRYYLDDRPSDVEAVQALCAQLTIDPRNPCQFLAQDAASEFPRLAPQEILAYSLRAAGERETLQLLEDLTESQDKCNRLESTLTVKRTTLKDAQRKLSAISRMKEDLEVLRKIEDDLELVRRMEGYADAMRMRRELIPLREEKIKREKDVEEEKAALEDVRRDLEDYQKHSSDLQAAVDEAASLLDQVQLEFNRLGESALSGERFAEVELRLSNARECGRRNREAVKAAREKISDLRSRLAAAKSEEELRLRRSALFDSLASAEAAAEEAAAAARDADTDAALLRRRLNAVVARKLEMESEGAKKMELLRRINADAHRGVIWLRHNLDLFQGKVHEPIMLLLKLRDQGDARYLQHAIGRADLECFVCEKAEDASELMRRLRGQEGLRRINVFHSPAPDPDPAAEGGKEGFHHRLSRKPPGFRTFLSKCLTCPPAVLAHLCRKRRLHEIPIFEDSETGRYENEAATNFRKFYIGTKYYEIRMNRYSPGRRLNIDDLVCQKLTHFLAPKTRDGNNNNNNGGGSDDDADNADVDGDDLETREVEADLIKTTREKEAAEAEVAARQDKAREAEAEVSRMRKEADVVAAQLGHLRQLRTRLTSLEVQLSARRAAAAKAAEKSQEKEKREAARCTRSEVRGLARKAAEATRKSAGMLREGIRLAEGWRLAKLKLEQLELQNATNLQKAKKAESCLEESRRQCAKLKSRYAREGARLQEARKRLVWTDGKWAVPEDLMDRARHQCRDPLSLPYLRDRADALENQRRDLPCYTESQKKECRDREAAVIKVQTDVSRLETELLENLSFSRKRERQLSESAERLVEAVDRRFFELCRQLGLSGCVGLVRGRDALDFRGFGVDIRVMFGAASEMMRLSGEVQSGGEKSVCTALYLMALQEMPSASAPFRWVDEINQGMDEKNERFMWSKLVSSSSPCLHDSGREADRGRDADCAASQLFYLAPKMPLGVAQAVTDRADQGDVTFAVCYSGSVDKTEKRFDMESMLRRVRRNRKSSATD